MVSMVLQKPQHQTFEPQHVSTPGTPVTSTNKLFFDETPPLVRLKGLKMIWASIRARRPHLGIALIFSLLAVVASAAAATPNSARTPSAAKIDFNRQIRPIITENCYKCHGPD